MLKTTTQALELKVAVNSRNAQTATNRNILQQKRPKLQNKPRPESTIKQAHQ
jgi:hypothetical protein